MECEHDLGTLIENNCEYCTICGVLVNNEIKVKK